MVRFVFKITETTMHFFLATDCAETPFQHILPRSKLARDLKDVFKRCAHFFMLPHVLYVFWFCDGRCQFVLFLLVAIHCCIFLSRDARKTIRAHLQICFLTVSISAVSCKYKLVIGQCMAKICAYLTKSYLFL